MAMGADLKCVSETRDNSVIDSSLRSCDAVLKLGSDVLAELASLVTSMAH